jgi:hypothetical protein
MKAVLLDRDGVINALVYHQDSGVIDTPFTPAQFRLLPRVPKAIGLLNDLGLRIAVVSNQPGIAKGHLKPEMLKAFERTMVLLIGAEGGRIDHIHYCLHHKVWANSGDLLGHSISDPYGSAPSSLASLNIRHTITYYPACVAAHSSRPVSGLRHLQRFEPKDLRHAVKLILRVTEPSARDKSRRQRHDKGIRGHSE